MATPFQQTLAKIKQARVEEGVAVESAQLTEQKAQTAEVKLLAAEQWRIAAQRALYAFGLASAYCDGAWAGEPANHKSCMVALDGPIGGWDGGKGKPAKERAWYYNHFADILEWDAQKLGAPPPKPKPPPKWVTVNVLLPPVLVDDSTGAEIDPSTGLPVPSGPDRDPLGAGTPQGIPPEDMPLGSAVPPSETEGAGGALGWLAILGGLGYVGYKIFAR